MSAGDPRLPPLPREKWTDDAVAALRAGIGDAAADRLLSSGTRIPNVLTTLMRHPGLAGPFLAYNSVLLSTPEVSPRHRELMILRVAWRTRSTYEWVQHVRMAQTCGISAEEVDAIARGTDASIWAPLEADLLAATDQLLDRYRIDDDTWARLAEQLDARQLIEVTFIVGTYAGLGMAFNSLGLELDPELDTVAAPPLPNVDD